MLKPRIYISAVFALLLLFVSICGQQGNAAIYLYDENGRLSAVISLNGDAVVYEFDSAGNFTAIDRLSASDLHIIAFIPRRGPIGTRVTIYGTGFGNGVTGVAFNGVSAQILSSNAFSVVAEVAPNTATGPVTVTTPAGTATSTDPFVVRGVGIAPHAITVSANDTVPFTVIVSGLTSTDVTWSVNGILGGNPSVGTISTDGFYTAPNLVNSPTTQYTVRATSTDDLDQFDEAVVSVISTGAGYQFNANTVSVQYGTPPNTKPLYLNDGLSVRYGTQPNNQPIFVNDGVSVRYGTPLNNQPLYLNDGLSVRYGTPANISAIYSNDAVSVGSGPFLFSLSPGTIPKGTTTTLTANGTLLNGATGIECFRTTNGAVETGISFSNINVNISGTTLTATITVNSSVANGNYIIVIVTPAGATVRSITVENTIQVTP
jgi:hypothetical protein